MNSRRVQGGRRTAPPLADQGAFALNIVPMFFFATVNSELQQVGVASLKSCTVTRVSRSKSSVPLSGVGIGMFRPFAPTPALDLPSAPVFSEALATPPSKSASAVQVLPWSSTEE